MSPWLALAGLMCVIASPAYTPRESDQEFFETKVRLFLQKMLNMRPKRRSETRSNVIEEVRNRHWQEIDP